MHPDDLDDVDFSNIFEGLTDKIASQEASFLSEENQNKYNVLKENLYMELLVQYEREVLKYLDNTTSIPDNLVKLQELLTKHKNI